MHNHTQYHWVDDYSTEKLPIKLEVQQPELSLLSPPSSPSLHNQSPVSRRRSVSPRDRRARPYPSLVTRFDGRPRAHQDPKMSSSAYHQWPSTRPQRSHSQGTSSSDGHTYNTNGYSSSSYIREQIERPSSCNSTVSPAWGEPPEARTPPGAIAEGISWTPPAHQGSMGMHTLGYPSAMSQLDSSIHDYRSGGPGGSPPSSTFTSPTYADASGFRASHSMFDTATSTYNPSTQEEIRILRKRVHDLERINERERERIRALEAGAGASGSTRSSANGRSPLTAPPVSASFQESWRLRTEARQRQFCSLNRAGNALCAWHDSRRERRAYPPRMAPPGYLNCGCTFEEALFEESLSRHDVGSYLPGENVRMDPALRNPLLRLLQERYGYQDGDFERDPRTGDWLPGEGHAYWQQQLHTNPKRHRPDSEKR